MKIRSLRFKINVAIIITTALLAAIFGGILFPLEMKRYHSYEKNVYLLLDTIFDQRKDDLANELFARQKRTLAATLEELQKVEGMAAITVYLPNGEVFLTSDDAFSTPLTEPELANFAKASSRLPRYDRLHGRSLGVYSREIGATGMPIGYVRLYYNVAEFEKETRSSIIIFATLLLTTLILVSGLLNLFLSRSIIQPISSLRRAIQKLKTGILGVTVELTSRDEIGEFGDAFNEMSVALKGSQMALQRAEEKYRGIFENAIEGIFQRTPGDGKYLTVNPSMVRMMGYDSHEELLASVEGTARRLYVNPEDHEEFERILRQEGCVIGFETQVYRKDGNLIRVSVSAHSVCDESGAIQYYEGSFVDVTERKEKEKAQREREAAEAANKAKSEFLANMSHEIRTPMNAILGFTSLLGPLITSPQQKSYLHSIQASGKSLMSLINDILDLSKIEAGKMEIQYEPVCLHSVFDEFGKIFSLSTQEKGLEFITEVAPNVPNSLLLDEVRLRQVLFNLVGNAVKFTDSGWIKLLAARSDGTDDGRFDLFIVVEDTGKGIQPEALKEIFEPFRQHSGQDAKLYGGTGLGLTISSSLVEMMGGTITVQSQPGAGSVFEIHLPNVRETSATPGLELVGTTDADLVSSLDGTVLVVDDIEVNRQLIKEFLRNTLIEVIEADNGYTALHAARKCQPDLILMDIKMPVMDGYEALQRLRQDAATQGIPVLALTATGMREDIQKIHTTGFDGWLLRPFHRRDLWEKVSCYIKSPEAELHACTKSDPAEVAPRAVFTPVTEEIRTEIIHAMQNELMERWEVARRKQSIKDIEDFGRRLKALGECYEVEYLSIYAENLLFHLAAFDVENIRKSLDAYPELVARLETLEPA